MKVRKNERKEESMKEKERKIERTGIRTKESSDMYM